MKKILLFFAAAACAIASWAQTNATVSATVKSQTLEVALTNETEDFVAFQMDITLPEGVTVADNGAVALVADRLTQPGTTTTIAGETASLNFTIAYNQVDATHVRVLAYNLENRAIVGKEGALFNVTFAGTPAANFVLDNVLFVTTTDLVEIKLQLAQSEAGEEYELGDVNRDHKINAQDLTAAVEVILTNGYDVLGDVNIDTKVNAQDLTGIVELILSQPKE